MLCPIQCTTCGCPVGDKEALFRHMRAERVREIFAERGTAPAQAMTDAGLQIDCRDIFELLGIGPDCCRMTLAASMVFEDYH